MVLTKQNLKKGQKMVIEIFHKRRQKKKGDAVNRYRKINDEKKLKGKKNMTNYYRGKTLNSLSYLDQVRKLTLFACWTL